MRVNKIMILLMCSITAKSASPAVSPNSTVTGQCYHCNTLYRKWDSEQCTNSEKDCGNCVDGYTVDIDRKFCIPKNEITVNHNESAIVPHGSNVTIECHFEKLVDCVWQRRESLVDIRLRYSYLNGNGEKTNNCSIKISNFSNIDVGHWSCQTYANSEYGVLQSTETWLTLRDSTKIIVKHNDSALVPEGESVVLRCYFLTSVYCAWLRRNSYVEMTGRYHFVDTQANDNMVKDCSITITDFKDFDVGQWDCTSMALAEKDSVNQAKMALTIVPKLKIVKKPQDQTVQIGRNAVFTCEFNREVTCQWKLNQNPMMSSDTHLYSRDTATRNCNLTIVNVSSSDYGNWTCTNGNRSGITSHTAVLRAPVTTTTTTSTHKPLTSRGQKANPTIPGKFSKLRPIKPKSESRATSQYCCSKAAFLMFIVTWAWY